MIAAVIAFAAAALAFAGAAVALAITGSKHRVELGKELGEKDSLLRETIQIANDLKEDLEILGNFRTGDKETIKAQENQIESLRTLLREHAPSGVARIQFDRMLQEAGGEDGDSDADGGG